VGEFLCFKIECGLLALKTAHFQQRLAKDQKRSQHMIRILVLYSSPLVSENRDLPGLDHSKTPEWGQGAFAESKGQNPSLGLHVAVNTASSTMPRSENL
jgi:hypothetical protein